MGTVPFVSHHKKAGTPVWSQERGPSARVVPLAIPDPEKVHHLEAAIFKQSLEDRGADPRGVLRVDPNTVVLQDFKPLLEVEWVGRRDNKLALIFEMMMHVREEQSWVR